MRSCSALLLCFAVLAVSAEVTVPLRRVHKLTKLRPATPILKNNLVALTPAQPKPNNELLCEVCKLLVGLTEKELGNNKTLDSIENFLENKVCHLLPSFLRTPCDSLVETYAPVLAKYVDQDLPAPVACAKAGLCPSGTKVVAFTRPLKKLKPAVATLTRPLKKLTPAVVKPQSALLCEVCKLLVGFAESALGNNKTVEKIEHFLENDVCGFLPKFLQPECNATVAEYAPILAQYIEQKLPAPVACAKIGLCSSSSSSVEEVEVVKPLTPLVFRAQQPKPQSGLLCEVCKLIVGFVESELGNNATVQSIENFLENDVCTHFPSFLVAECKNIVEQYTPLLAKFIDEKLPAPVVCAKTGLCSSYKLSATDFKKRNRLDISQFQ